MKNFAIIGTNVYEISEKLCSFKLEEITSVNVKRFGYSTVHKQLYIEMMDSKQYLYLDVPTDIWEAWEKSDAAEADASRYFPNYYAKSIKGQFRYHDISGEGIFIKATVILELLQEYKKLQHEYDTTQGLWATDVPEQVSDPNKVLFQIGGVLGDRPATLDAPVVVNNPSISMLEGLIRKISLPQKLILMTKVGLEIAVETEKLVLDENVAANYFNPMINELKVYHGDKVNITGSISDGYHTFDELYEHRIVNFIALCKFIEESGLFDVWRSRHHSDGSVWGGWFILGINHEQGKQITYHLPDSKWEECVFASTLDKAPEFDGHTSADVLERLKNL